MPPPISFEDAATSPIVIGSSLPLPGSHVGRRIMQLDLGLDPDTSFLPNTLAEGTTYAAEAGVSSTGQVDRDKAANFLRKRLLEIGFDRDKVERSVALLPKFLEGQAVPMRRRAGPLGPGDEPTPPDDDDGWVIEDPILGDATGLVKEFASEALDGKVAVPGTGGGGSGDVTVPPEVQEPDPQLFLIEKYAISSFLGDYGMGRTVRTFTLLPGESTTIRLKTWQSTTESVKHSSSIIDSHEQSARDRFARQVQDETTDKKTKSKTESWSVEAKAKASWGWGSASVKGTASGEYQSGREQFARQLSETTNEHAQEASSRRELSVTSSTETTTETGTETLIEREINNVNMRRVLNFVFRELNQEYRTKLHLIEMRCAYTNGLDGTWREVPISGLRTLLTEVLQPDKIDEVAQAILKIASVVFDAKDEPVRVLEAVDYDNSADTFQVSPLPPGPIDPPTDERYYRFKRGPLAQGGNERQIDGVLLSDQTVVMRTDSVIVEALLGEADALDSYAMQLQEAAANEKTLQNERETLVQNTLAAIADPETRASLAAKLYNPPTSDES